MGLEAVMSNMCFETHRSAAPIWRWVEVVVDNFAEARQRDILNLAEELEYDFETRLSAGSGLQKGRNDEVTAPTFKHLILKQSLNQ